MSQLREGEEVWTRWLELDGFRMGAATQACRARDDVDGGSFQTTMQHGESLPLSFMEPSLARDRVNCGLAAAVSSSRFKVRAAHGCGWRRVRGSNRKEDQGPQLTIHSSSAVAVSQGYRHRHRTGRKQAVMGTGRRAGRGGLRVCVCRGCWEVKKPGDEPWARWSRMDGIAGRSSSFQEGPFPKAKRCALLLRY